MYDFLSRTSNLIGEEALEKLSKSKIIIFGVGGVGSYVTEVLARAGVGNLVLFDGDTVNVSNINRQLVATHKTIGEYKVDVMKRRILDINPEANVIANRCYFNETNSSDWDFSEYDYIVDAIDSVSCKVHIAVKANNENARIISSMGTGNKLNPMNFKVCDIYKTQVCPLARVMRRELKKSGIKKLKVVYSDEKPVVSGTEDENVTKKIVPTSISFVPSVAGLIIASEVIKDIIYN